MFKIRQWLFLILLFAFGPCFLLAQITTGNITGTVTDQTGAIVPGAKITLTDEGTGAATTVQSASTGTYAFEGLQPGSYAIRATAAGFDQQVSQGIQVHVQQTVSLNITLQPGNVVQNVTVVSAGMPLLQSQDASVGQTIDKQFVDSLPLNGRNWVSLGQLAAGTTTTGGGTSGQPQFSADGVNFQQNDYRLNGIDDNLEVYGLGGSIAIQSEASVVPIPDAIEEFKMQNGDYSAEFGHSTGAVINAVVKSGTKQFHGDLFEYLRNTVLDANSYFSNQAGIPRSAYHQNQYGGTIGGPAKIPGIYSDTHPTFFFFDYQKTSIDEPYPATTTVPTANMVNSGYTNLQDLITDNSGTNKDALGRTFPIGTVLDPATTRQVAAGATDPISGLTNTSASAVYVRDPFYNGGSIAGITNFTNMTSRLNMLPATRLDPNAIKLLGLYPLPTSSGFSGNYYNSPTMTLSINQYDIRVDHNINDNNLLWGVFDWYDTTQFLPGSLPGLANGGGYGVGISDSPHYAVAVSYTHLFSPTLINEIHVGLDRDTDNIIPPNANTAGIPAQYGIQGVPQFPGNGGLPTISISDLNTLGVSGYQPVARIIHSIETLDTLTKIYRSHTFKWGYQLVSLESNIDQPPAGKGDFTFSGEYSDIPNASSGYNGISDFLLTPQAATVPNGVNNLGGLSSFSASSNSYVDIHRWYMGAFFQDDWKVTPTLTLNLGVRWDHFTPNSEISGRSANLIANGGNGPGGTYYMPDQTCNQATSSFLSLLQQNGIQLSCIHSYTLQNPQYINFAPRLGFAYSINPKLVVRGGYGIAYGALDNIGAGSQNAYNFPFVYSLSFTSPSSQAPLQIQPNGPTATLENALTFVNLTNPADVNPQGLALVSNQYNYQVPYTQTYNLAIQRQFGNYDSVQFAYVGDVGRHLDNIGVANSPSEILPPGTNNYDYIPFPDFGLKSSYISTSATSSYNSLQITYNHQISDGLSLLANYTYSKCMTDLSANRDGITQRAQWLPGFGINADNQLCPNDATNVIHVSGLYQLPFGHGRQWMANSNRAVDAIAGGWVVNFIYTRQTGQPFTVPCVVATTSDYGCNANVVPGVNIYGGKHNQQQWVNPAAFASPPVATQIGQTNYAPLGGQGMQARGPGFNNLDASVFKNFPVKKQIYVQFRAEAFNVTNTAQFANPGSSGSDTVPGNGTNTNALTFTNTANFGKITALINNNRVMQLALKLYY